jgi:hypothetical protein
MKKEKTKGTNQRPFFEGENLSQNFSVVYKS